jgi:hypothetical protein
MKKYDDPENTPLKFHDFFIYLLIPFNIISNLILTLSVISEVSVWSNSYILDIGIKIIDVVFVGFMFIGLFKRKTYGWVAVIIYAGIMSMAALVGIINNWSINPQILGDKIPVLIYMLLLAIYYIKRKALFLNGSQKKPTVEPITELKNNSYQEQQIKIEPIESEETEELKKHDEVLNQIIQPKRNFRVQSVILNWVIIIALVISVLFAINNQRAAATARAEANSLKEQIQVKDSEMATLKITIDSRKRDIAVLQSEIKSLESDVSWYSAKSSSDSDKLSFMDSHVVIVADDGSKLYHKYGCSRLNLSYFWIYNSEAAWDRGYRPCSYCN